MQKLRHQKALLAICLALPLTLTINKATNAMRNSQMQNGSQIKQHSQADGQKETTNIEGTFLNKLKQYIHKNKIGKHLEPHELTGFLQEYIDDDIPKYLALLILAIYDLLPTYNVTGGGAFVLPQDIHIKLSNATSVTAIMRTSEAREEIRRILNLLNNLNIPGKDTTTLAGLILSILFKGEGPGKPQDAIKYMYDKLEDYSKKENITENKHLTLILNYLEPVANQLLAEYLHPGEETKKEKLTQLLNLQTLVSQFSEAYKRKQNNQPPQPTDEETTFTYNAVEYLKKTPEASTATNPQCIQFLRANIKNNIEKYLAVMIQAHFKQIPNPGEKPLDEFRFPDQVFYLLYTNPTDDDQTDKIINEEAPKRQILNIINTLTNAAKKDKADLTKEEHILRLLLTYEDDKLQKNQVLTKMEEILEEYKTEGRITVTEDQSVLISYLDSVSELLNKEHEYQQGKHIDNKLDELATIVKEFSDTCKIKLQKRQKRQKNTEDTLLHKLNQYKNGKTFTKHLDAEQTKDVLRLYIGNDIKKYISLIIHSNFNQLPDTQASNGDNLLDNYRYIYNILKTDPTQEEEDYHILDDADTKNKISNILKFLQNIGNPQTNEEKILSFLFKDDWVGSSHQYVLNEIQNFINDYKKEKNNTVEKNNSIPQNFLTILGEVADQLDRENAAQHPKEPNSSILGQLAQIVRDFCEAYKSNHTTEELQPQEIKINNQQEEIKQKEAEEKAKKEEKERLEKEKEEEQAVDIDINGIEKLINDWIKQKEKIITDKEEKLKQLEQAINSLEKQYSKIVNGR